ncbi:hypothetical protein [Ruminococcus sp. 5_1_39BFAA]|uniref:hypothetical protein n=1 Tax=Ruminococcus sp. 5_1_39BFAA TaxID=457412 RepID=UPI0035690F9D
MYKKKNNAPLYITIAVVVLVLAGMAAATYIKKGREKAVQEAQAQAAEEIPMHDVLLYKTNAASIEFEKEWLKSDNDTESVLRIQEDTLVTLIVTPKEGYYLEQADIVDYDFHEVNNFLRETSTEAIRVNFVMPDTDIIINFDFAKMEENEEKIPETENAADAETEQTTEVSEPESPYGLTLHGVTADVILSFNGQFDDREFLQQLGDALHIDSARSEYREVTDVTFSSEAYEGEQESDKVYHYIYFNEDPAWRLLATYYLKEDTYLFTELVEEMETETQAQDFSQGSGAYNTGQSSYGNSYSGGSTGGYGNGSVQTVTTTTAFDIMQVSTTFLAYVGGKEAFYQKAFEYVLSSGLTGNIIGTMSSYEILPEEQKAEFKITLNTGGSIKGTYSKANGKLQFSGL